MASKDLKVNVVVNAKTKQLDTMFKKLNKMQTKLNKQATAQNKVTNAVNKTNKSYSKQKTLLDQLTTKVHRLANAYLGVMAAKVAINASDTITRSENKLNNLNEGDTTATQKQLDQMYASAQKVRMGYGDMMDNVSKSMMLAGDAFGGNIDNAIRFQEVMAEAYSIGGASDAEMSSSMYQMIQALGSGILQGDELRSVREGAPLAYKEIEKLAQEIYGADENLKDLASQGKITSDIVVRAMLQAGEQMDAAFAQTDMTFAQAWTNMKNVALKSFEPVLQKMNDVLNSPVGQAIVNGIGVALQVVATMVMWMFNIISVVFTWIAENWNWLKWIAISVLVAIGIYLLTLAASAIAAGISAFVSFMMGLSPLYVWILVIGLVIAFLADMGVSFSDVCGFIVGALNWVWTFFKNVWFSMLNIANGVGQALSAIGENIKNAFTNAFLECKAKFWDFVGAVTEGVLKVANLINKVLGVFGLSIDTTNLEDAVQRAKTNAEESRSKKLEMNDVAAAYAEGASTYDTWQDGWGSDAFNAGYDIGADWGQGVTDKLAGLGDTLAGALNLGGLATDQITPNLEDINGNTEVMADSMQLTAEDLKYLRDVANMEWKKEFTTANITVDMTNNNTVSNDFDLNSLAVGLRELVEEEMYAVANGTYV